MFNRNTIWVEFELGQTIWFGGWKDTKMGSFGDPTIAEIIVDYYPSCKFEILSRQMDRW